MGQSKRFARMLHGLEGVTVWVYEVAEDAQKDGVSRQHLQDAVVVRLLDAGIRALGIGNVPEPPGNPWLNIFVNTVKFENVHFYWISVKLDEVVRLDRDRDFKSIGTTWEACSSGVIAKAELPRKLEKAVDELIDYFVYDYHYQNPQQ
jgi:hypothetical protein